VADYALVIADFGNIYGLAWLKGCTTFRPNVVIGTVLNQG